MHAPHVVLQLAWFFLLSGLAARNPDASQRGAYCVLWVFGIPLVSVLALAVGYFLDRAGNRR